MKITGFKVLKGGIGGIQVDGIDLVNTGTNRVMFKDNVSRVRKFPLTLVLRNAIAALNYPFMVGAEYWQSKYAMYMKPDYSRPDRKDQYVNDANFKELVKFWESCRIVKCEMQKESYKLTGEFDFAMCTVKATVLIAPGDDHSLYSLVDEALSTIVTLIDQTLSLPQTMLTSSTDIQELVSKISNLDEDQIADDMSPEEAFMSIMKTASKKGYSVMLDDNMLSLLSHSTDEEPVVTEGDFNDTDLPQFTEAPEDIVDVVSKQTKDESIFQQEPIDEENPS